MLELHEEADGKILTLKMSGKLATSDYEHFLPEVERLIAVHGKIRILCQMHDFHGWQWGAFWQDIKFDFKHFADIERIAFVGETRWQHGMALFCKPFTRAKVRYFDESEFDAALEWIWEGLPARTLKSNPYASIGPCFDVVQEASEESFPASDAPSY